MCWHDAFLPLQTQDLTTCRMGFPVHKLAKRKGGLVDGLSLGFPNPKTHRLRAEPKMLHVSPVQRVVVLTNIGKDSRLAKNAPNGCACPAGTTPHAQRFNLFACAPLDGSSRQHETGFS